MKIGKPVTDVPNHGAGRLRKYDAVYEAVKSLPDGDWLPVDCETEPDAVRLTVAIRHSLNLTARRRRNVVYIKKVPS